MSAIPCRARPRSCAHSIAALARDAPLERSYYKFLAEYEALGHMEEVAVPQRVDAPSRVVYLPHHAVMKEAPGADAKLRVVFNASRPTSNGTSLNDHMLVGPKLQRDILAVLLQWRLPRFAPQGRHREDVPADSRAPERR